MVVHSGNASRIIGPVVFAHNWSELSDLAGGNPGSPVVVDPFFADYRETSSTSWLRTFCIRRPSTPLISYTRLNRTRHRQLANADIPLAARLQPGLDDDFATLDTIILRSIDALRIRELLDRVGQVWCAGACRVFRQALDLAIGPAVVPELAACLGISTRTLNRHCTELGVHPPKTILSLARVFTVERLAEWSRQPGGRVAIALGFSDRTNYRRLVRRTLGFPPTTLRSRGGTDYVVESIVKVLATTRCRKLRRKPRRASMALASRPGSSRAIESAEAPGWQATLAP